MKLRIIKKKCPYCGADTQYRYGEHELKCNYCHQSCIIEYERPPFSDLLKLMKYCEEQSQTISRVFNLDFDESFCDVINENNENYRMHWIKRAEACKKMLEEAIDEEIVKEQQGE